jgi:acyl carrier protein
MAKSIQESVIEIIAEKLRVPTSMVTVGAHLTKDLSLDSLDRVELAGELEEKFSIEIDDSDYEKFQSVQDVIDLVAAHVQPQVAIV